MNKMFGCVILFYFFKQHINSNKFMKKIIKVIFFNNALSLQKKKILNSNWLKAVQFKYNIRANYNKYYLLVSKATLYY